MGKYADPTVNLVDKTYENLAKGIVEGSKGVAAGMKAFQEREAKKAKQLADKISGVTGQYDKATADYLKKAQTILDNGEFDQSDINRINGQLNQAFYDGKDRLKNLIASGASQAEIDAALQKEITGAQSFGVGVAAMGEIGKATVKAESTAMKNDGKDGGSVLVNQPEYVQSLTNFGNDQLSSFTVVKKPYDPNDPNASNWNYDFRIDKNKDGEYTDDEIINIPKMGKNFEKGKAYFYTMPDDKMLFPPNDIKNMLSEDSGINSDVFKTTGIEVAQDGSIVTTTTKTQLDPDLVRENLYAGKDDDNYSGSVSQQVDTIIESFDGNKPGWQTYYQKFYGAKALADYMDKASKAETPEDLAALEAEAKEMVKNEYISRKIIPGLSKGEVNIKPRVLTTSTSVNIKENKGRQDLIRSELKTFVPKAQDIYTNHKSNNPSATSQSLENLLVGSHYGDAPGTVQKVLPGQYTQGGGGQLNIVSGSNDGNTFTIITKSGNQTHIAKVLDMTDGNFTENITKPYVDGDKDYNADDKAFGNHLLNKGLDDDTYQGATSITSRGQQVQGGGTTNITAGGSQTSTIAKKVTPPVVPPSTNSNQNQNLLPGSGSYGSNAQMNPQTNVVQFNFNGLNVDADKAYAGHPVMSMKNDGDDYIRSMGNFETLAGNASGGGVKGYGFSGANAELAKLYKNAPGQNNEEKFIYSVNNYIIGKDGGDKEYGGKSTILNDLGISRSEFDALPEDVRKELVDWKFNTGRGTTDVIAIAADVKINGSKWDGDKGYRSNSPKASDLKGVDLKNLDVAKLKAARQALYKGRIDGLKADIASGKVDPNDKPKGSTETYAQILKFAEDGYNNSQQYR